MSRVLVLDGWRGCAVLAVLIAHFGSTQGINLGRFGVELFFVLSGRLMAEILFVRRTALPGFYWRRVSRVYPAMLVLVGVMFASAALRGGDPTAPQFVSAALFTSNYTQGLFGRSPVLDHIWSLCVEEHMYLLLGAIAWAHRRFQLPVIWTCGCLAAIAVLSGLAQTAMGLDYYAVYWRSDVRGASILMGVIAYLVLREGTPKVLSGPWAPILLGAAALLLNVSVVPDPIKYSLGTAALAVSLVLIGRAPAFALRILEHPLLLRAGVWSYSIYLWQQPFAKIGGHLPMRAAYLALALILAVASFYLVEQPARRFLNGLMATRRSTAPV